METKVYVVGCVGCGPKGEHRLDLENDNDVAVLGITVATLLVEGHAPIVIEKELSEEAHRVADKLFNMGDGIGDVAVSYWRELN